MIKIHPTAIVDKSVTLGSNVSIGAYSIITGNTVIDEGTEIHSHCSIGTKGEYPNYEINEKATGVYIGKNCVVREFVTVNSSVENNTTTIISDNCFLMSKSHISHDCNIEKNVVVCMSAIIAGYCKVGEYSYIGTNSSIHQRSSIGKFCMLGAQSFFKGSSADGITWVGIPAKAKKVNIFNLDKNVKDTLIKQKIIEQAENFIKQYKI